VWLLDREHDSLHDVLFGGGEAAHIRPLDLGDLDRLLTEALPVFLNLGESLEK
jgi:hypothetical protein